MENYGLVWLGGLIRKLFGSWYDRRKEFWL